MQLDHVLWRAPRYTMRRMCRALTILEVHPPVEGQGGAVIVSFENHPHLVPVTQGWWERHHHTAKPGGVLVLYEREGVMTPELQTVFRRTTTRLDPGVVESMGR